MVIERELELNIQHREKIGMMWSDPAQLVPRFFKLGQVERILVPINCHLDGTVFEGSKKTCKLQSLFSTLFRTGYRGQPIKKLSRCVLFNDKYESILFHTPPNPSTIGNLIPQFSMLFI